MRDSHELVLQRPVVDELSHSGVQKPENNPAEDVSLTKNNLRLKVEIMIVSVIIVGVWILLSLPILFYHLPISVVTIEVRPAFYKSYQMHL